MSINHAIISMHYHLKFWGKAVTYFISYGLNLQEMKAGDVVRVSVKPWTVSVRVGYDVHIRRGCRKYGCVFKSM